MGWLLYLCVVLDASRDNGIDLELALVCCRHVAVCSLLVRGGGRLGG